MKLKTFTLAALAIVSLSACSGDDDGNTAASIVGKWTLESEKDVINGQSETQVWEHLCPSKKDYVEFKSDGEFDWIQHGSDCEVNPGNSNTEGGWSQEGDLIHFTGDPELTVSEIETLTSTKLVLKEEIGENAVHYLTLKRQ